MHRRRSGRLPLDGGEVTSVEVWGGDAQVRMAGDTLFLTETTSGLAGGRGGAAPRAATRPYDCEVEGP